MSDTAVKVTISDPETGEVFDETIIDNDYSIVCAGTCHVASAQVYANGTHVLTVIDVPTRAKVASIPLGESCLCVGEFAAASYDGTRVYFSNFWSNTVSAVDTATNSVVRTYPVQPFPGAMAVGDELSVYVDLLKAGRTSLRLKADAIARTRDGTSPSDTASIAALARGSPSCRCRSCLRRWRPGGCA